ncbi:MAG: hypothetical protein RLZ63_289 [Pseudomonadota bacterium]|jgi:hypothetical protein
MPYIGGAKAAQNAIDQLQKLGALINVYSSEWLSNNPKFPSFGAEELADFDSQSGGACSGHLLVISTSLDSDAVTDQLLAAYPGFAAAFGADSDYHKPDFIFINLATQQILCVGLGRKNYIFGYAIGADGVLINDANVRAIIDHSFDSAGQDATLAFMNEMIKYDYGNVVINLIESLYEFGVSARAWDQLPSNPEVIEEILELGPNEDGMYDIDDELMSEEQVREVLDEFEQAYSWGKENLSVIQDFFPELTWADLNTQDY